MVSDKEKDLYIKSNIKDGKIPHKIDELFENQLKIIGGEKMEENINETINEEKQQKPKKKGKALKIILSVAACAVLALGGGNIYATTKGYDNVFFMIKDWITQSTETDKKDKILSDRDITISYQPIQITDNISILISKMQIKDNDAKLFVSVRRNDVEKEGELPLNYKIYNLKKNILCDQNSKEDSNSKESIFEDELIIKNYSQQDTILDFEIYKPNGELLTTLYINLEDKEINVVGMGEYLEKISEIELKKFLESITELPKAGKKYNSVNCIDIPNISYSNGIYTTTYTYCFLVNSLFDIQDTSKIDIYQNTAVIKLKESNGTKEFELVSIGQPIQIQKAEIPEGNLDSLLYGDVNCDGMVNEEDETYLLRHLANWPGYELTEQGWINADVDNDGKVNNRDGMILARHLANWPGYEKLPFEPILSVLYGDVNCDKIVDKADVEYLQKSLLGMEGYPLAPQGRVNADVNEDKKIDDADALIILRHIEGMAGYETLPVKPSTSVLYGDVNCDGVVDNADVEYLTRHLANWPEYELTEQGTLNADVDCNGKVNNRDRLILTRHLANWEGYEVLPYSETRLYEDVNCDGIVNEEDETYLLRHLASWPEYELTEQGTLNADVDGNGKVNNRDGMILSRHLANWEGYETLPYTK